MRVEGLAVPFGHFGMALLIRVGQGCDELVVARRPADILRWTASDGLDQQGIGQGRVAGSIRSILIVCTQPSPKS